MIQSSWCSSLVLILRTVVEMACSSTTVAVLSRCIRRLDHKQMAVCKYVRVELQAGGGM